MRCPIECDLASYAERVSHAVPAFAELDHNHDGNISSSEYAGWREAFQAFLRRTIPSNEGDGQLSATPSRKDETRQLILSSTSSQEAANASNEQHAGEQGDVGATAEGDDGVTYINDTELGQQLLVQGIQDNSIHTIILRVDLRLVPPFSVNFLDHALSLEGDCNETLCLLDGGQFGPLLDILLGGTLVVRRLSLCHFHAERNGGFALLSPGGVIAMYDSNLENNTAGEFGGLLFGLSANIINFANCNMTGNYAGKRGAVLYALDKSATTITNCNIIGNRAEERGAMMTAYYYGSITVADCEIRGNSASDRGALFHGDTQLILTISNSIIADNRGDGNLIFSWEQGVTTITETLIDGNWVTNPEGRHGIVLEVWEGIVVITDSIVTNSYNDNGDGTFYCSRKCDITVSDSLLAGNVATSGGVFALNASPEDSVLTLTNCTVTGNQADNVGSLSSNSAPAGMPSSVDALSSNSTPAGMPSIVYFGLGPCGASRQFCGLRRMAVIGPCSVHAHAGCGRRLVGVEADSMLGWAWAKCHPSSLMNSVKGGVFFSENNATYAIVRSTMKGNVAHEFGGVFYGHAWVNITITESIIADNTAYTFGGAFYIHESGVAVIMHSSITANTASLKAGVMFANEGVAISMLDCVVMNNNAQHGGVLYAYAAVEMTVRDSRVEGNTAGQEGGVVRASFGSSIAVIDSTVTHNHAGRLGGAMFLSNSSSELRNVSASHHTAIDGGAIFMDGSRVVVGGSAFFNNSATYFGGAIHATLGSIVDISGESTLASNSAEEGGSIYVSQTIASLVSCTLQSNVASTSGGALAGSAQALISVRHSLFVENVAPEGGAVSLQGGDSGLALGSCHLVRNSAHQGGAAYLVIAPHNMSCMQLHNLSLDSNSAELNGPNLFWEYAERVSEPECVACTHQPSTAALLASTLMRIVIMQNLSTLDGGVALNCTSGAAFSPFLTYTVLDFYGSIVQISEGSVVVANAPTNGSFLTGSYHATYGSNGATFTDLALVGYPGRMSNLTFEPFETDWAPVTVLVAVEACRPGSHFFYEANICEDCQAGSIKFDNSTEPCSDCSQHQVVCNGLDEYTLDDGYWLAAASATRCVTSGGDTLECVFQRIYMCDVEEACSSLHRTNKAGEFTISAELQCATGYRSDVPLCGACQGGYEQKLNACERCPSQAAPHWVWFASAVISVATLLAVVLGLMRRASQVVVGSDRSPWLVVAKQRRLAKARRAQGLVSVLAGYVQVMGQHAQVFDVQVFPKVYLGFLQTLSFSFSVVSFGGFQCMMAGSTTGPTFHEAMGGIGTFYVNFLGTISLLALILAPLVIPSICMAYAALTNGRPAQFWGASEHDESVPLGARSSARSPSGGHSSPRTADEARSSSTRTARPQSLADPLGLSWTSNEIFVGESMWTSTCETPRQRYPPAAAIAADPSDCMHVGTVMVDPDWSMRAEMTEMDPYQSRLLEGGHGNRSDESCGTQIAPAPRSARNDAANPLPAGARSAEPPDCTTDAWQISPWGEELFDGAADRSQLVTGQEKPRDGTADTIAPRVSQGLEDLQDQMPTGRHEIGKDDGDVNTRGPSRSSAYRVFTTLAVSFLHPSVASSCFKVFYCDSIHFQSTAVDAFLHFDRTAQCYTTQWRMFATVSCGVILLFVFLYPIGLIALTHFLHRQKLVKVDDEHIHVQGSRIQMTRRDSEGDKGTASPDDDGTHYYGFLYSARHPVTGLRVTVEPVFKEGAGPGDGAEGIKSRLDDPEILAIMEPYLLPFRPTYFYWSGVDILIRLLQTSVVVIVKMAGDSYDIVYAVYITVAAQAIHTYVKPYKSWVVNYVQTLSFCAQAFSITGYITQSFILKESSAGSLNLGIAMLCVQFLFLLVSCNYVMKDLAVYAETELGDFLRQMRTAWLKKR
ncbi:hypothetical protein CYMTET_15220 [Cymbomonas tetramitiformis]|uniref:Uncharacterized protein n=1 Tax=Cymbomonas tetramitiformis TaxID=36881 RepID=A0AAE0L9E1_9CHLO|nr:hypothetical protein CYMTET_15220 [Cymbomonas tetramitiformis]